MRDEEEGHPSRPLPLKGEEHLGGSREQKASLPPKGGEAFSPQEGYEDKEGLGELDRPVSPTLVSGLMTTQTSKPVVTSNVIVVGPKSLPKKKGKQIQLIEKEMSLLQTQLKEKAKQIEALRGKTAASDTNKKTLPRSLQTEKGLAKSKEPKAPKQNTSGQIEARKSTPLDTQEVPKETYATVTKKRVKKATIPPNVAISTQPSGIRKGTANTQGTISSNKKAKKKKPPKTAAVIISCPNNLHEVIREAKSKVNLAELGIENTKTKRSRRPVDL